jgi:hypothetical protein
VLKQTHILYLVPTRVLVDYPLLYRVSPVLHQELLRVLLALPITKPALRLRTHDEVRTHQIHFQKLSHLAANLCLWTPSAAIFLLP